MAIRLVCPRCKQLLSVGSKMAGNYANCPRCTGRFWVPKDAHSEGPDSSGVVMIHGPPSPPGPATAAGATTVAAPPVMAPPRGPVAPPVTAAPSPSQTPAAPPRTMAAARPPAAPPVAMPPKQPVPGRKIARMISADSAASSVSLAADGRLPELHLDTGEQQDKADAKPKTVHPLVLFGVLVLSVVMSVILASTDFDAQTSSGRLDHTRARQKIADDFCAVFDRERLKPYQVDLREAQRAHSRGDHKTEHALYRKVLRMLRSERGTFEKGLTGSRQRDRDLENLIAILLHE